jgi:hypothetical protein
MTADRMSTDCAEKMEAQIGVWCKVIGALLSIPLSKRTTCDAANTSLSQLLTLRQSAQPEPASSSTCKGLSSSLLQTSRAHTQSSGTEERTQKSASEDEQAAAEKTTQRTHSSALEHDQATAMASRDSTLTPQEMQAMQLDSGAAASREATSSRPSTNGAEPHGGDAPAGKDSFSIMLDSGSRSRPSEVPAVLERTCGQRESAKEVRTVDDLEVLHVHCQSGSPSSSCLSSQDVSAASPSSAKSRDLTPCTRPGIVSHNIIVRVRSEGF